MRVTIFEAGEAVLDFDAASENVLAPTARGERAAAFAALCGALAVVAGLDSYVAPGQSIDVNALQPTDNVAPSIGTVTV